MITSRSTIRGCLLAACSLGSALHFAACGADDEGEWQRSLTVERTATGSTAAHIINGDFVAEANSGVPLLEVDGAGYCTSELLANQWAATARHCLSFTGSTYALKMGTERVTVDRFFVHPTLDFAVMHTATPLTMNGATTGYQRPLFSGSVLTLVGQDVACYGYGNNADASGFGTLRVGQPIRVTRLLGTSIYEITLNGRGQIPWRGDSGGLCVDSLGNMTGIQSNCYLPTGSRFGDCQQVAMTQDVREFLKPVQFEFIKSCTSVSPDPASPGDFLCNGEATAFRYGTKVVVLAKLKNVKSNHRFRIRLYSDRSPGAIEQISPLMPASPGGLGSSYFSMAVPDFDTGSWNAVVHVDADDGLGFVEMGRQSFTINSPYRWLDSEICSSIAAPDTCIQPRRDFTEGDTVYGLLTVANITADYRFSFEVWSGGFLRYDFTDGWKRVGAGTVARDSFYPAYVPRSAGAWEYRFFVELDDGKGRRAMPMAGFNVYSPYIYRWSNLCRAIVADAWGNPVCDSPTRTFRSADTWHLLTQLTDLRKDVRVKYQLFYEGAFNGETTTAWRTADPHVIRSYFDWSGGSFAPGNWAINVLVEANDGKGFRLFEVLPFVVVP